ncbi:MAG: phosphopantetheine-binding protein [Myxococcota bacterium]
MLDELKVNSARLVDVVLEFEDAFDIEIADEDIDRVETVGNSVQLIVSKLG